MLNIKSLFLYQTLGHLKVPKSNSLITHFEHCRFHPSNFVHELTRFCCSFFCFVLRLILGVDVLYIILFCFL